VKFLILSMVIIWQVSGFTSRAISQEPNGQAGRLHFTFPFPDGFKGRYELTASNGQLIHPNGGKDSILELRGNVEMRTIVCRPASNVCDKSPLVLRADAIDFNETTGEIQAQGSCIRFSSSPGLTPNSKPVNSVGFRGMSGTRVNHAGWLRASLER
jgi:hypothetical protein